MFGHLNTLVFADQPSTDGFIDTVTWKPEDLQIVVTIAQDYEEGRIFLVDIRSGGRYVLGYVDVGQRQIYSSYTCEFFSINFFFRF